MILFNLGRLTEYDKKKNQDKKKPSKVTNAYVCRLSLSLTWGWHSVSRRQCHGLKNKTTVPIITCNQLIRLRLISAIFYTSLLVYCYYDSDTSKQVMPQIIRKNCYKKGVATEYMWCISVNVQGGSCPRVLVLWCISVNVQGGMYISNVNQTLVFISGGVHFVYVSDGVFCVYNESSI